MIRTALPEADDPYSGSYAGAGRCRDDSPSPSARTDDRLAVVVEVRSPSTFSRALVQNDQAVVALGHRDRAFCVCCANSALVLNLHMEGPVSRPTGLRRPAYADEAGALGAAQTLRSHTI